MTPTYKIHPGIGIARLGNSPTEFYIAPEKPGALPTACDRLGNPLRSPDGQADVPVREFKDAEGRIKRQAARFQVWVYDDESPDGRPLELGDAIRGGGNDGVLVDIQWRVYLANKKAVWYEFEQLEGEHGYAPDHPRRNPQVEGETARQRLIIDPGPRVVDCKENREARFDRESGGVYAATFPPEKLEPCSIDTLGEIKTDNVGRLLVLGGHGHSGTYLYDEFGQPRIDHYANNDGWFDDTSDGPVMARLVMYETRVDQLRFIDVESPAWVVCAYPAYVPQILDMITTEDVLEDLFVRQFATRPELYGKLGTFDDPQHIDPTDTEALIHWRAGRLTFNDAYKPWFYRDIWPILFRPDEFSYLTAALGQSNFPHNQSPRGNFDPYRLGIPPVVDRQAVEEGLERLTASNEDGELFLQALAPDLTLLDRGGPQMLRRVLKRGRELEEVQARRVSAAFSKVAHEDLRAKLRDAAKKFAKTVKAASKSAGGFDAYLAAWKAAFRQEDDAWQQASEALDDAVDAALESTCRKATDESGGEKSGDGALAELLAESIRKSARQKANQFISGQLLEQARKGVVAEHTYDPFRDYRRFLFELLRQPGEENSFGAGGSARSRTYGLPLMPLLAGDNPISNTLPSQFLRLTDLQLFLLRQWDRGHFYNEALEGWGDPDPWEPYAEWQNETARELDRGVLMNVLGGAFCPGGEIGWIQRNPSIYQEPYRLKANEDFYAFRQTAAQANNNRGSVPDGEYEAYTGTDLSQENDFDTGLEPGDLTKYMALPWQADFNECSTQMIDVTYDGWNDLYPESEDNTLLERERRAWETLWWPAHRPLQVFTNVAPPGQSASYRQTDWARGVPGTLAGDLKMATEWWRLPFVLRNPSVSDEPSEEPPVPKYIGVERTEDGRDDDEC